MQIRAERCASQHPPNHQSRNPIPLHLRRLHHHHLHLFHIPSPPIPQTPFTNLESFTSPSSPILCRKISVGRQFCVLQSISNSRCTSISTLSTIGIMILIEPLQVLNPRSSFFGLQPCASRVMPKRCALPKVPKVPKAGISQARVSRREMAKVGLALPFLAWGTTPEEAEAASVSRRVRLKDVENPKLQEALRAAVVGDLENAETLFSELLEEDPESASVWSNRGSVRVSLQKFEQAAEDFTKAIALAPDAPVPFLNRAISYEAMGRYDDAIVDCKTAIVNDPEEYAAWFNLGNVLVRVSDFDAALKSYARASVLAPGIAGYRLKEALVLFELDRLEETRKLVQGLVRKYPNYAEAHAVLAAVLWKEGNRAQAEGQFIEATSREPRYQDIRWVASELQWPPGIMKAMSKFLNITY